jgi:hypothetical protein
MAQILVVLNHKNPTGRGITWPTGELRRLVAAWDDTGRDAGKTLQALPELNPYLHDKSGRPAWSLAFGVVGSGLQFIPEPDVHDEPTRTAPETHEARLSFVRLLFNELRDSLAGPCKWKHCGKYWIRELTKSGTYRKSTYCCRRCCQYSAASICTKRRLQREHADKLEYVTAVAQRWAEERRKGRTRQDWKQWVNETAHDITPKFLTRAVNKGELTTKGKLTAKGKTFVKEHLQRKAGRSHAQ